MAAAEAYCTKEGLNFTPQRRRVLEILLSSHKSMGAYDILEVLKAEGSTAQPPVAYRALEFLVTHRLAHRVESRNAFIACMHPGEVHSPVFLICRECDEISETETPAALRVPLDSVAEGFQIEGAVVEARGICDACRKDTERG